MKSYVIIQVEIDKINDTVDELDSIGIECHAYSMREDAMEALKEIVHEKVKNVFDEECGDDAEYTEEDVAEEVANIIAHRNQRWTWDRPSSSFVWELSYL